MTEPEQEPFDPALIGSFSADFQHVNAGARERIAARLASSVGALALNRSLSEAEPRVAAPKHWLRLRLLSLGASFVLGGLCGAGLYGALRPAPRTHVVYGERASAIVRAAPPLPETSAAASAQPVVQNTPLGATPPRALGSAGPSPGSSARSAFANLAEQQALLDVARAAFGRSEYLATLALLKTHVQRFPNSVLGEEREALGIKTLAAIGRMTEAQARAARFKAQFPQSLLLPSVNDSLHAIP